MPTNEEKKQDIWELFCEYHETKSEDLRNTLVEKNLYLARILASKYVGRGIDFDDLYQVASYALTLAVERFDVERGLQFASFATPTIIGEIKRYFRDTTWSLKVPRRLKEISMQISIVKEELYEKTGRVPTVQELSMEMGVSEEDVLEALESGRAYSTYSLDQEVDENSDEQNASFEKYLGEDEEGYSQFEFGDVVNKLLDELSESEREILMKRFFEEMSQRQVAKSLGVSQMTVSRIEKAIREKFKNEYGR